MPCSHLRCCTLFTDRLVYQLQLTFQLLWVVFFRDRTQSTATEKEHQKTADKLFTKRSIPNDRIRKELVDRWMKTTLNINVLERVSSALSRLQRDPLLMAR